MAGIDTTVLALSKKYTDETVVGGGAIKGKNCIVSSITAIEGGHRVTFQWTLDNGTVKTGTMDVMDGADGNGIYIAYIVGSTPYASDWLSFTSSGDPLVPTKDEIYVIVSDGAYKNTMYRWDDDEDEYECISGQGGSSGLTDSLTTSVTVGGITSGTTYAEGTSLEDILRDMLNPVAYPTLTNPSVGLTGTGSKLLEVGDTLTATFTAVFNRGLISPAYGTSGYRAGVATGYSLNEGTEQVSNTWDETVTENNNTFKASASYEAGEQPKDSIGRNYSSPLPAGSVESSTITYKFDNAMWANTSAITTVAKLSLIDHTATKQRDMVFPAQTAANPEIFDVPASWTVTAVQVRNDLSGQYEDASAQFTVTDTTHEDAAGNTVNYKRYTFNLGYGTGARTVKVRWS